MNTNLRNLRIGGLLLLSAATITSCQKDVTNNQGTTNTSATIAVAASQSAAIAAGANGTDSVYVMQPCERDEHRTPIAESALSASITSYLSTTYSGYTFVKAFSVNKKDGSVAAYVVIIFYNDKPVALLFDSSGTFVRVLEQREHGDIDGHGWHEGGGRFCDRDGHGRDTIAINLLPVSILTYMAVNYPGDTLVRAFVCRHDTDYVVISRNNGLYATVFSSTGVFIRRVSIPTPPGNCTGIAFADLPANVQVYIASTYPNYVFEKAFAAYQGTTLRGYVVIIDANNTKYGLRFDASGNFVDVRILW